MSTINKKIRLGDDLSTYCGKCKEERTHQVVALSSDGRPERVVCRTCHSNHLYRENKAGGRKATGSSGTRRERIVQTPVPRSLRPYAVNQTYEAEQWISHPKFGEGKVTEVKAGGKIAVQFGRETRTLLHAG